MPNLRIICLRFGNAPSPFTDFNKNASAPAYAYRRCGLQSIRPELQSIYRVFRFRAKSRMYICFGMTCLFSSNFVCEYLKRHFPLANRNMLTLYLTRFPISSIVFASAGKNYRKFSKNWKPIKLSTYHVLDIMCNFRISHLKMCNTRHFQTKI